MSPLSEKPKKIAKAAGLAAFGVLLIGLSILAILPLTGATRIDPLLAWRTIQATFFYVDGLWQFIIKERTLDYTLLNWFALGQALGLILGPLLLIGGIMAALQIAAKPDQYGDARWATDHDLKKMGLSGSFGPVLGKWRGKLLRAHEAFSALILAPTRVGKTRGCVIPTVLTYPGSMVILDPKKEVEVMTSTALRAMGKKVFVVDWANTESPDGWNPLGPDLPEDTMRLELALSRMAVMLWPEKGGDDYWGQAARRNFVAFAMFEVLEEREVGNPPTLGNVVDRIESLAKQNLEGGGGDPVKDKLDSLAEWADEKGWPALIANRLVQLGATGSKERSSHLNMLTTGIGLWGTEAVRRNTSKQSFTYADFRKEQIVVYVPFALSDAKAFGPLTAIFLEGLFGYGIDNAARREKQSWWARFRNKPRKFIDPTILVVGEEWASMPKIPLVMDVLAKGNGVGIHTMIILQDLAQFREIYTEDGLQQLLTNCTHWVCYAQANPQSAKLLSDIIGNQTVIREKFFSGFGKLAALFRKEEPKDLEGQPLIRPEQWGTIPFGKLVLMVQGHFTRPILAKAAFWDKDRKLSRLMKKK